MNPVEKGKMETKRNGRKLGSVTAVALLALAIVPLLATSASAGSVPGAAATTGTASEWAYGGAHASAGQLPVGAGTLTWNSSAGVDVIYNATNTSANVTELTATRTVVVTVTATYSGPFQTWTYNFKAAEDDLAYANVTNAATVELSNGTNVPAVGILNASLHANATVAASLLGSAANKTVSDYLNVSGWAKAQVAFTPALGLVPLNLSALNLTGISSWSSTASLAGSAAWNVSYSFVNHGWNGTTRSHQGDVNGTWSTTTQVTLTGILGPVYAGWTDHRARIGIGLQLSGPFDLYAGVLLVPHAFDLFRGAGSAYTASGLGQSTMTAETLYLNGGRVSARSVTAAYVETGASTPGTVSSAGGTSPAVVSAALGAPGTAVYAQPMSPAAAESQASCLQYGCAGPAGPLRGLIVPLAIAGVAAVVAVALIFGTRSRRRGGKASDIPLSAMPSVGPAPPTGSDASVPK